MNNMIFFVLQCFFNKLKIDFNKWNNKDNSISVVIAEEQISELISSHAGKEFGDFSFRRLEEW